MLNPFAVIRRLAAEAVLGGVSDAIQIVAPDATEPDLAALRERFAERLALPEAQPQEEPARRGRK